MFPNPTDYPCPKLQDKIDRCLAVPDSEFPFYTLYEQLFSTLLQIVPQFGVELAINSWRFRDLCHLAGHQYPDLTLTRTNSDGQKPHVFLIAEIKRRVGFHLTEDAVCLWILRLFCRAKASENLSSS